MAREESRLTGDQVAPSEPIYKESSPEEIRREIERTRAQMDATFDELSDRVSPRHLLDDILDFWEGHGPGEGARSGIRNTTGRILETVREHPVPASLIGAGLAWLMFEDKKPPRSRRPEPRMYAGSYVDARTGEPYDPEGYGAEYRDNRSLRLEKESEAEPLSSGGESSPGIAATVKETAQSAKSKGMSALHGMGQQGTSAAGQVGDRLEGGRRTMEEWLDSAPLALGAAALAVGLAAGLLLPESRREKELMGEASDELQREAGHAGEEALRQL